MDTHAGTALLAWKDNEGVEYRASSGIDNAYLCLTSTLRHNDNLIATVTCKINSGDIHASSKFRFEHTEAVQEGAFFCKNGYIGAIACILCNYNFINTVACHVTRGDIHATTVVLSKREKTVLLYKSISCGVAKPGYARCYRSALLSIVTNFFSNVVAPRS